MIIFAVSLVLGLLIATDESFNYIYSETIVFCLLLQSIISLFLGLTLISTVIGSVIDDWIKK